MCAWILQFQPAVRWTVSKEHDGFIMSDFDENLQGPTMYMCASFDVFLTNEQDGTQT